MGRWGRQLTSVLKNGPPAPGARTPGLCAVTLTQRTHLEHEGTLPAVRRAGCSVAPKPTCKTSTHRSCRPAALCDLARLQALRAAIARLPCCPGGGMSERGSIGQVSDERTGDAQARERALEYLRFRRRTSRALGAVAASVGVLLVFN